MNFNFYIKLKLSLSKQYIYLPNVFYHGKVNQVSKRGSMLQKMVEGSRRDKNKNWHLSLMSKPPQGKPLFEKIHRPAKRATVLNSLLVRNITDVLSTGDVAPEILGNGIEISSVRVTPDCEIANIYWLIPPNKFDAAEELQIMLAQIAPKIRSELISRNVLGRVPRIYFVRDATNARSAEIENALAVADLGPSSEANIVPENLLKNIFTFDSSKTKRKEIDNDEAVKSCNTMPENPKDMRSCILGLDHDRLMKKVINSKTKAKIGSQEPSRISLANLSDSAATESAGLFDNMPGTPLYGEDRSQLIKQFSIDRKVKRKQLERAEDTDDTFLYCESSYENDAIDNFEEDYINEDVGYIDEFHDANNNDTVS